MEALLNKYKNKYLEIDKELKAIQPLRINFEQHRKLTVIKECYKSFIYEIEIIIKNSNKKIEKDNSYINCQICSKTNIKNPIVYCKDCFGELKLV